MLLNTLTAVLIGMGKTWALRFGAVGLASVVLLNSCATPPAEGNVPEEPLTAHNAATTHPELMDHWHLAKRSPPTFYPNGYSKDAPTHFRDGEWVVARNGGGMWFIPFRERNGVPRDQLIKEAMAWRDEVHKIQKKRRREQDPSGYVGEALAKTAIFTAGAVAVTAGTLGGAVPSDDSPFMTWLGDMWDTASE